MKRTTHAFTFPNTESATEFVYAVKEALDNDCLNAQLQPNTHKVIVVEDSNCKNSNHFVESLEEIATHFDGFFVK